MTTCESSMYENVYSIRFTVGHLRYLVVSLSTFARMLFGRLLFACLFIYLAHTALLSGELIV